MLPRIVGIAKSRLRQRSMRIRDVRDIGIAQERKNRVVVRSRRNFDLPAFGRQPVFRQNRANQFELLFAQRDRD